MSKYKSCKIKDLREYIDDKIFNFQYENVSNKDKIDQLNKYQYEIINDLEGCESDLSSSFMNRLLESGFFHVYNHIAHGITLGDFKIYVNKDSSFNIFINALKRIQDFDKIPKEDNRAIHGIFHFLTTDVSYKEVKEHNSFKEFTRLQNKKGGINWFINWIQSIEEFKFKDKTLYDNIKFAFIKQRELEKKGYYTNDRLITNTLPVYMNRNVAKDDDESYSLLKIKEIPKQIQNLCKFLTDFDLDEEERSPAQEEEEISAQEQKTTKPNNTPKTITTPKTIKQTTITTPKTIKQTTTTVPKTIKPTNTKPKKGIMRKLLNKVDRTFKNYKTLGRLKRKYGTRYSMNLPNVIFQKTGELNSDTNERKKEMLQDLKNAAEAYDKRSKTRKAFNRLRKRISTWFKTKRTQKK